MELDDFIWCVLISNANCTCNYESVKEPYDHVKMAWSHLFTVSEDTHWGVVWTWLIVPSYVPDMSGL